MSEGDAHGGLRGPPAELKGVNALALRALWQTGRLYPEQVPPLAVDLLAKGADSRALREVAGMDRPTRAELDPLLERMFSELGVPRLDADVVWRITAREVAAGALAGTVAPYDAALSLYGLWSDYEWPQVLTGLVGLVDEWDQCPGERAQMEAEILGECRQLLAELDAAPRGSRPGGG